MLRYSRAFLVLALTLLALSLAAFGATLSPSYKQCARAQEGEQSQSQQASTLSTRVGIIVNCESVFANENGAAITGIATVLLTVVTGILGFIAYMQFIAAKNQARPYVFASAKEILEWAPNGPMKIKVVMENLGTTPAYSVEWAGTASIEAIPLYREKRLLRKKQFMEIAEGLPHSVSPLAKEPIWSIDEIAGAEFTPGTLDSIYAGQLGVYIYSRIWHRDVFGAKYISESCHYIGLDDIRAMIDERRRGKTVVADHMHVLHAQEFNQLT